MTVTDTPTPDTETPTDDDKGVKTPPPPLLIPGGIEASLPDALEYVPGGVVKVTVGSRVFNLRRPSMDEFLVFRNAFQALVKENEANPGEDQTEDVLAWVNTCIGALADADLNAIERKKIPPWLGTGSVATGMIQHWREVPTR